MALTYEEIIQFMTAYFPAYSNYGQDPATVHVMNDFYASDFVFTGHVGREEPVVYSGRDAFLAFDISHPSIYERLTPVEMGIDEHTGQVFAVIKFEFIDRSSDSVLTEELGASLYQLVQDESGKPKIKSLLFFPQRLPPGAVSGAELFQKHATGAGS